MMQNNKKIDLKHVFPSAYEEDAFETITKIESEIITLINEEVIAEKPTNVYIVGRRGKNLFHPFFDKILENQIKIGYIRLYKNNVLAQIKGHRHDNGNESIVLTDAIRKGDEITNVLKVLSKHGVSVSKVCGYLSKRTAIESLSRDVFPKIRFKFVHEIEDEDTYKEYYGKLVPVHHSRLEPLDSEHPYYMYQFTTKMEEEYIKSIICSLCDNASCMDEEDTYSLRSNDIVGYSAEYDGAEVFKELSLVENSEICGIERLVLRLKYMKSKSLLIVVAICILDNVIFENIHKNKDCRNMLLPSMYKYCEILEEGIGPLEMVCPLCIDTNLSIKFLNKFDEKLKLLSDTDKYEYVNHTKYNPFTS